jgi:hypothetical protein
MMTNKYFKNTYLLPKLHVYLPPLYMYATATASKKYAPAGDGKTIGFLRG